MLKKALIGLSFLFLTITIPLTVYFTDSLKVKAESRVIYEMPYPGILPDHPLYFFKVFRDQINLFFTRDYQKKADIYILYSDKRVAASILLLENGKEKLALDTLAKAEKYFFKIPFLISQASKHGQSFPKEFIEKIKTDNEKHAEIIDDFLKKTSEGQNSYLLEIQKINRDIKERLTSF